MDFFDFCNANNLVIGSHVTVIKQYMAGNMTEIKVNDTRILLNSALSDLIMVKG
jgi:Fe2+ transport system protein FeoA